LAQARTRDATAESWRTCQKKKVLVKKAHISDYCDLNHDDEKDLEKALVQQVPAARFSVASMARRFFFGFYRIY